MNLFTCVSGISATLLGIVDKGMHLGRGMGKGLTHGGEKTIGGKGPGEDITRGKGSQITGLKSPRGKTIGGNGSGNNITAGVMDPNIKMKSANSNIVSTNHAKNDDVDKKQQPHSHSIVKPVIKITTAALPIKSNPNNTVKTNQKPNEINIRSTSDVKATVSLSSTSPQSKGLPPGVVLRSTANSNPPIGDKPVLPPDKGLGMFSKLSSFFH